MDMKHDWNSFIHWKGWKSFARGCVKSWDFVAAWQGWKKLFCIPFTVLLLAFIACCGALIWIFLNGKEQWPPVYGLYALSAYLLIAVCVKLPKGIHGIKAWMERHPKLSAAIQNTDLKFRLELYLEQFINFAYGIFKIASGVVLGSAWVGCDGIYNFAQALIQLFQILRRKKSGTLLMQWKSYRFCGYLILLMHLTLIGIVFQMVNWGRVEENGEIMIIATAAFAFYKFISSFIDIVKDRKHVHPVDSSVRMLELSQAIFAMFSLQAGLLHTFGTGESWEHWMNLATGCVVCLMTVAMGIYMICRGNREIKKYKENGYGE